jgi:hypothetical protein
MEIFAELKLDAFFNANISQPMFTRLQELQIILVYSFMEG